MKANKKLIRQYKSTPKQMTPKEIDKLKEEATNHALDVIVAFSLMALRDEFEWGEKRLMQFHTKFFDLSDSYNKGYISVDDLWNTLKEEVNITIEGNE